MRACVRACVLVCEEFIAHPLDNGYRLGCPFPLHSFVYATTPLIARMCLSQQHCPGRLLDSLKIEQCGFGRGRGGGGGYTALDYALWDLPNLPIIATPYSS